jgi:protein-tyrosine-phosphatase
MNENVINVLFLCSGNSARSIMAECILQAKGNGQVRGFSAGCHPTGRINALTFNELTRRGYPVTGLKSKSWQLFLSDPGLRFDFVISVCEQIPDLSNIKWPGQPTLLEWELPAPGAVQGSDVQIHQAFSDVCDQIENKVQVFLDALPLPA